MRENDKTSIVFHFLAIERRKQFCNSQTSLQLDSTCMFGVMFKNIGDSKTISLAKRLREGNTEGKARFHVKHIIDCLLSNQG